MDLQTARLPDPRRRLDPYRLTEGCCDIRAAPIAAKSNGGSSVGMFSGAEEHERATGDPRRHAAQQSEARKTLGRCRLRAAANDTLAVRHPRELAVALLEGGGGAARRHLDGPSVM